MNKKILEILLNFHVLPQNSMGHFLLKTDKTIAFYSFGCKLNQSETQSLEEGFKQNGYSVVDFNDKADYYVIDTCTVTDQADAKCRNIIRKAERINPDSRVIVTGCMAQMEAEKIKKINPKSLVIGTFEKMNMLSIIKDVETSDDWENAIFVDQNKTFQSTKTAEDSSRTRAFLKVQDGCNYICSFCIIPFSRGRDRSNPLEKVVKEAKELIQQGFNEIVLTGVNIGEYKDKGLKIDDLVETLSNLHGMNRLRVSSIEPNTVTDRLISLMKERSNIMPHFHIPIQSGSTEILQKMRRHYDRFGIEKILDRICNAIPNLALGSDFIVGFPNESEENFADTVSLIENFPFTYFHTFTYSSRQQTIAERMENHIDSKTKHSRSEYLRKLNDHKKLIYAQKNIGLEHKILTEANTAKNFRSGFTENYIKVFFPADQSLENKILKIALNKLEFNNVYGDIVT